jgi:hypothetical protein
MEREISMVEYGIRAWRIRMMNIKGLFYILSGIGAAVLDVFQFRLYPYKSYASANFTIFMLSLMTLFFIREGILILKSLPNCKNAFVKIDQEFIEFLWFKTRRKFIQGKRALSEVGRIEVIKNGPGDFIILFKDGEKIHIGKKSWYKQGSREEAKELLNF